MCMQQTARKKFYVRFAVTAVININNKTNENFKETCMHLQIKVSLFAKYNLLLLGVCNINNKINENFTDTKSQSLTYCFLFININTVTRGAHDIRTCVLWEFLTLTYCVV